MKTAIRTNLRAFNMVMEIIPESMNQIDRIFSNVLFCMSWFQNCNSKKDMRKDINIEPKECPQSCCKLSDALFKCEKLSKWNFLQYFAKMKYYNIPVQCKVISQLL